MEEINPQEELKKEFEEMQNHPNTSIGCTAGLFDMNDYFNWKISFIGPKDSEYAGGLFFLKITFPKDFPNSPPQINFQTPIYHLNVRSVQDPNSKETLGCIKENTIKFWEPSSTVKQIITKLYAIFYVNNPNNSYLSERATEFENDINLFKLKATYFTNKYAGISNLANGLNSSEKDWNLYINKYFLKIKNVYNKTFGKNSNHIFINEANNINENITLKFIINGKEEKSIECNKTEPAGDVIERFKKEIKKENDENILFIFGLRSLIVDKSIGENGLKNNHYVTVISDY